jgi:hypothetical protein
LGRPNTGAAPIAVIRFDTSARCSISSTAIPRSVLRQPGVCHPVLTQQRRLGSWNQDVR